MCEESASVYACMCVCACLCVTDVERVVKWDWRGGSQKDLELCPQEVSVFSLYHCTSEQTA